jgi:hypothetical protein
MDKSLDKRYLIINKNQNMEEKYMNLKKKIFLFKMNLQGIFIFNKIIVCLNKNLKTSYLNLHKKVLFLNKTNSLEILVQLLFMNKIK